MSLLSSTPQPGTPASVPAEPSAQTTPEKPVETQPLTIADVERIAEEKATRIAQSMVDKAENRISRKAQEQIKALDLNKSTLGLSDEQVTQAKQRIVYEDLTTPAEQASPAAPVQPAPAASPDPVVQETLDIFAAEGVTIEPSDPEYKALDLILRDPKANIHVYRKELYKQIEAKRTRITEADASASARVVTGGSASTASPNDISNINDSKELYRIGARRIQEAQRK